MIRERDFTHANSPKHQQKGTALSQQQYATLPKIIADPLVVVWDKKHQNLIYVDQDRTVKVIAELSPKKAKFQPKEKLDTVINTYKLDYDDFIGKVKLGDYVVVKGEIERADNSPFYIQRKGIEPIYSETCVSLCLPLANALY